MTFLSFGHFGAISFHLMNLPAVARVGDIVSHVLNLTDPI